MHRSILPRPSTRRPAAAVLLASLLYAAGTTACAADAPPPSAKPLPVAIVDVLNKLSGGPHTGYRANHAKGVLVTGEFVPAPSAASLSKAPHFAKAVPVLVRFSNATGVPTLADADDNASPHGMAIRFDLPDGTNSDLVCISANGFPVATPENFLGLLQAVAASGPDAPKPTPIEKFLGSHPAALKFVTTPRPAPESFATLAFYGVNAFKFTNAKGESRFIRYQILPVTGEKAFGTASKPTDHFLMDELPKRVAAAPVKFRLVAQLAEPGDTTTDPTVVWPADRKLVELGTISLNKVPGDREKAQRPLLFNPLALPPGIEASADPPVLLARPAAYAVSFGQRAN